jgi:hypothetical protein
MNNHRPVILFAALLLSLAITGTAQELVWNVDADVVFNNREGGDEQTPDQTFLFTRLAPELGVALDEGRHTFKGGVAWYQPINDGGEGYKVLPIVYYQFRHRKWQVALGAMPRRLLRAEVPRYMWSDSLRYCQPRLRGALVQYGDARNYVELALDWRQMQSRNRREAFAVLVNADWNLGAGIMAGGHVQYNHLAKRKDAPEGEGVNDDVTINPMLGIDATRYTSLDLLRVDVGAVVQMQRCRAAADGWLTPSGFVADARLRRGWFEARESLFAGKDLFPLYPQFGSELNLGDPYYRSKFYSRTEVVAHVVNTRFVDLTASLSFHATNHVTGFWQQIACRFYIDNNIWRHRRDKGYLRGERLRSTF